MGKIGDLFVRLGIKKDGYTKGMAEAKKENEGFSTSLGKMKAGALAVWAAVGTAVVKFAQEMINGTNRIGDAWNRTTAQMKAGWDVFIQSVSNWDWGNFASRIREAAAAAKELQNALDAEFEVTNSIRLQEAKYSEELSQLKIDMRDQTKSYEERAAAAKKYLEIISPLYDQEKNLRKELQDANIGKWLAGSGLEDNAKTRQDLINFLIDYGKDNKLAEAISLINDKDVLKALDNPSKRNLQKLKVRGEEYLRELDEAEKYLVEYANRTGNYNVAKIALVYENMRGDKDTVPLVESIQEYWNSISAMNRETARIQTILNSATAATQDQTSGISLRLDIDADSIIRSAEKIEEARMKMADDLPKLGGIFGSAETSSSDIVPDDWLDRNREKIDKIIAEKERLIQAGDMLADALTYGTTNALDELANAIAGVEGSDAGSVVKALLSPLADAAVQAGMLIIAQGTAVEAFKKSLMSLQGAAAIAAGATLVALGVAAKAGLASIGSGAGSGSTGMATSYNGGNYGGSRPTVESQELTVYVKGTISGSDIILASDNTQRKWNR